MESKVALARTTNELKKKQEELQVAKDKLSRLMNNRNSELESVERSMRQDFYDEKEDIIDRIETISNETSIHAKELLTKPQYEIEGFENILQDDTFIDALFNTLTEEQVQAYTPISREHLDSEEEIREKIKILELYAEQVPSSFDVSRIFKIVEKIDCVVPPNEEGTEKWKELLLVGVSIIFVFIGVLSISSLLLITYCTFGILMYRRTRRVIRFLDLYSAVDEAVNGTDLTDEQKERLHNAEYAIDSFVENCKNEYIEKVNSIEYIEDRVAMKKAGMSIDTKINIVKEEIVVLQQQVNKLSQELSKLQELLKQEEMHRIAEADRIENQYLTFSSFDWKDILPSKVYLGKNKKGDAVLFPVIHNNVLFLAQTLNDISDFLKLFMMQLMMHVNPDYVSQIVIDYKYMASNLQQFMNLPTRSCNILVEAENINERLDNMNIDIIARNQNILRSVNSLEEFNNLMKTYDSVGECYIFVHVIGLTSLTETITYLMRNGAKVGYYFYVYLTLDEYQTLNSLELLDLTTDYFYFDNRNSNGVYPDKRLRMVMTSYLTK